VPEGLRGLRTLPRDGGYRAAVLTPERLWQVLENAGEDPSVRAGAAAALAPLLDNAGRARLRVTAEACAEPRLRVAMNAASEEANERGLEEALDLVTQPESGVSRRTR
jgi:hypothetical protein